MVTLIVLKILLKYSEVDKMRPKTAGERMENEMKQQAARDFNRKQIITMRKFRFFLEFHQL